MGKNGEKTKTDQQDRKMKQQAVKVLMALKECYPVSATHLAYTSPWELLVATELAAQCTDARVNLVTPAFFSRWPGPCELANADRADVESVIRSTGFFRNKARNLIGAARLVCERYGGNLPDTMDELVKLPGVARKTANIVLFAGFGKNDGMAVDTHVKRISYRLGLTESVDPVHIEQDLIRIFPREEWGDLNHRLVSFGRDVCKARKPACDTCPMAGFCPRKSPPRARPAKSEANDEP